MRTYKIKKFFRYSLHIVYKGVKVFAIFMLTLFTLGNVGSYLWGRYNGMKKKSVLNDETMEQKP